MINVLSTAASSNCLIGLFAVALANPCYSSELQIGSATLVLLEDTAEAIAFQPQASVDLLSWQNTGTPRRGDGSRMEFVVALPNLDAPSVYYRVIQTPIWAPKELDENIATNLTGLTAEGLLVEFDGPNRTRLLTTDSGFDGDNIFVDRTFVSELRWIIHSPDFNLATFEITATEVAYRSPFQATFTLVELAAFSGRDPPARVVFEIDYTGANEGRYTSQTYLLSGALGEQSSGSIDGIRL